MNEFPNTKPIPGLDLKYTSNGGFQSWLNPVPCQRAPNLHNNLLDVESTIIASNEPTVQQATSLQMNEFPNTKPIPGLDLKYTSNGGFQSWLNSNANVNAKIIPNRETALAAGKQNRAAK